MKTKYSIIAATGLWSAYYVPGTVRLFNTDELQAFSIVLGEGTAPKKLRFNQLLRRG